MIPMVVKTLVSALVIAAVSELARRSTLAGSLLASLPLTSILAMLWLYHDTRNPATVADLSRGIFWLVLPSLVLFITLPWLLARKMPFYPALGLSAALTVLAYGFMLLALKKANITF